MATHSSVLAWRIPGTGEPGGLPPMGLHRVRHDWRDLAPAAFSLRFFKEHCHHPLSLLANYGFPGGSLSLVVPRAFRSLDYLFVQLPTVQKHPPLDSLPDSNSLALYKTSRENVYLYSAKLQFQFSSFLLLLVPGGQHNSKWCARDWNLSTPIAFSMGSGSGQDREIKAKIHTTVSHLSYSEIFLSQCRMIHLF